jgi:hypothetical protein
MSMALEYEEEIASVEPEHPDRQILDRFFDNLGEGDLSGATEELRTLVAAGGSLSRWDIERWLNCSTAARQKLCFHTS